ncbi:AI-2E family transporter [Mangrovibrevibacter kandeliae]|uniref:AI-2E family transporter n=1 Tax=Mangrovibrevibacter kandeliae TaxID=2968473 RepID=UPI0021174820|nr:MULTISPECIES: AI-2E family transporter [unclassified Aurantimonas]MCQ8781408.1 AI-2E family transporter [Aurantimonas sp. CSK15Z-1]MCW4114189.1 AI-2E family transporter [Aurantimonas sp. MSK8Z-1]
MTIEGSRLFRRQVFFWSLVALVFVALLWVFSGILLPFVLGAVIAYFLDPIADWLERRGLPRLLATVAILFLFAFVFAAVLLVLVPVVGGQVRAFVEHIPDYVDRLQGLFATLRQGPLAAYLPEGGTPLGSDVGQLMSDASGIVASVIGSLWTSSLAVVNFLSLFVVTPVVAFYLLLDWDRMIAEVDRLVPRQHTGTVRKLAREIDRAVAGFLRGQGSVCLLLGTYYAGGLSLVGLNFGLLIGLFAGMISFVPYIGSMVGLILSVGVALVQFGGDWVWIVATLAVFFSGQFLEGNILQPKLVGASVGLHPVWLMFALFAFGALFGFVGLLIAVPAAAAVGVLVRFATHQYLNSEVYYGRVADAPPLRLAGDGDLGLRRALARQFDPRVGRDG